MICSWLLIAPLVGAGEGAQDPVRELPLLEVGATARSAITDEDPVIHTAVLDAGYGTAPVVGQTFRIQIEEPGAYQVELRSHFFDAYLVLRDGAGTVLGEDDDGWVSTHARIVVEELDPEQEYTIDACALHGRRGVFEVTLRAGLPAQASAQERARLELEDARDQVRIAGEVVGAESSAFASSLERLALLLRNSGELDEARPLYEQALDLRERILGPEHPDTATTLNSLARLLKTQGEYDAAQAHYERALAIREKVLGPKHLRTSSSLNNLAALLRARGEYDAARPLYERALAIREEVLGAEHKSTVQSMRNLAGMFVEADDYDAAVPLCERILAVEERTLGPEHPTTAENLYQLAKALGLQGDYEAAQPHTERALALREKILGPEHPDTARSLNHLGWLLWQAGDLEAALAHAERALAIRERVLGPEHSTTSRSSNLVGVILGSLREYSAARPFLERSLAIDEKLHGPRSLGTLEPLLCLADVLFKMGDYAAARPLYERGLAIREASLGPKHPDTAASLSDLGYVFEKMGEYAAALSLLERALAVREEVCGPRHPDTAESLCNLGRVRWRMGEYDAAQECYDCSLAIREETVGSEHVDTAESLNHLGVLYQDRGDYATARPLLERALAIREKVLGGSHYLTAVCLVNLGRLSEQEGDYSAARILKERALAIREETLGPDHPETAHSLNCLGMLLDNQGDYAAARPFLERSLAIREKVLGPDHPHTATSLNNLGLLLLSLEDLAGARPVLERSLAIREKVLGPGHPTTSIGIGNLAVVLQEAGDLSAVRELLERSLKIREETLGPQHPRTAVTLLQLAKFLESQGDYAGARGIYERAHAILQAVLGPEHPETVRILSGLASVLRPLGERDRARELLEQVVAIREKVLGADNHFTVANVNQLALVLLDCGEQHAAWDLLTRGHASREAHRWHGLASRTESERYSFLASLEWQLESRLGLALLLDDPGARRIAYEDLLAWKGQVARMLVATREELWAGVDEEQRELFEALRRTQSRLSNLAFATDIPDRERHDAQCAELIEERRRIEFELARSASDSTEVEVADFEALRQALPERAAAVDFFAFRHYRPARREGKRTLEMGLWSEPRLSVWITRAGFEEPLHLDLGPAAAIEEAVQAYLKTLVPGRGVSLVLEDHVEPAARKLRKLLWEPMAVHLEGVETVFVSPGGCLGAFPFGVLRLEDSTYLVEQLGFVYLQDLSALVRRAEKTESRFDSLLSVGGVDYRRSAVPAEDADRGSRDRARARLRGSFTDYWERLPSTPRESQVVFDLHEETFLQAGERLLLQGAEPSEERLQLELPRYSVVHVATHGFFQPEGLPSMWEEARNELGRVEVRLREEMERMVGRHPGLLSGLVCAGANAPPEEGREDGYLTAEEVGWLDLSGVELMVLSACETGLGRRRSGEGLIGLRRQFRTAGVETVISSLWSVGDESTAALMRDFYRNLWGRGMGRLEALRAAQLSALRRDRAQQGGRMGPQTWGAFVLSGEWR